MEELEDALVIRNLPSVVLPLGKPLGYEEFAAQVR